MQDFFENLMLNYTHYVYIIIFIWCIFEGEIALIIAGILAHEGSLSLSLVALSASLGAFFGDQLHFFIGRFYKSFITKKLTKQKRKFAIAHLLLQRYGWYIVFFQRFIYGFRVIIPVSIGITRYDFKKFAFINLISSFCWAFLISILVYKFGDEIWDLVDSARKHWYAVLPLAIVFFGLIYIAFIKMEDKIINKRKDKYENRIIRHKNRKN